MDVQTSPSKAENDALVSQGHELEYTLHECPTLELEKELSINNQDFPKFGFCEQHMKVCSSHEQSFPN